MEDALVSSSNAQRFVVRNGDLDLVENLDQLDIGDPKNLERSKWGIVERVAARKRTRPEVRS